MDVRILNLKRFSLLVLTQMKFVKDLAALAEICALYLMVVYTFVQCFVFFLTCLFDLFIMPVV